MDWLPVRATDQAKAWIECRNRDKLAAGFRTAFEGASVLPAVREAAPAWPVLPEQPTGQEVAAAAKEAVAVLEYVARSLGGSGGSQGISLKPVILTRQSCGHVLSQQLCAMTWPEKQAGALHAVHFNLQMHARGHDNVYRLL